MQASLRVVAVAMVSLIAASSSVAAAAQRVVADLTGNWTFEVVTENGTGVSAVAMTNGARANAPWGYCQSDASADIIIASTISP